ncbi:DUF4843 domain-containing protein [Chitinophaga sp. YIM B06452]|uniref:DUF4843 domain-containing protein n=1 Tax=Chitinophaga sp. YIM B06452 TaxID=3082158 RepID=UPI0031FEA5F7
MKKLLTYIIIGSACFSACKKTEEQLYTAQDNIYFDLNFKDLSGNNRRMDSVMYSFALFPEKSVDTVWLPVRIAGMRRSEARSFRIAVDEKATTAEAGKHYKSLEKEYIIPADSGVAKVPIILFAADPALTSKSVRLKLRLVPTEDFTVTNPEYDSAKVIFSNRLEKPAWWATWQGELGNYSRVKHELFIRAAGVNELPVAFDAQVLPKVLFAIRRFKNFLASPISWVADNPQEGYTLEPAGAGKYNFFSITNPGKKYLLELNPADNRYYFTDETGARIV